MKMMNNRATQRVTPTQTMDIAAALNWAIKHLQNKTPSAILDAEVLLAMVLKKTKEFLYAHPEQTLTKKQRDSFRAAIHRRYRGWPVAYLTGHQEFYSLDFLVTPKVLIPRPDTEIIIDSALAARSSQTPNIADIGTGSGCLAITLAKHWPQAQVWATDISPAALAVAKHNARLHQVKIKFLQGNLLLPIIKNKAWTKPKQTWLVTANLPYLIKKQLAESSIKREPRMALFGGRDGLKYYQTLLQQLRIHAVRSNQYQLFLEIDPQQKNRLTKLVKKKFPQPR